MRQGKCCASSSSIRAESSGAHSALKSSGTSLQKLTVAPGHGHGSERVARTSGNAAPLTRAIRPLDGEAKRETGAAQDFEALLIGQMLRSMREQGSSWLGTGDDSAGATAFAFGEEELAKAITKGGGLGLSKIIAAGLTAKRAQA